MPEPSRRSNDFSHLAASPSRRIRRRGRDVHGTVYAGRTARRPSPPALALAAVVLISALAAAACRGPDHGGERVEVTDRDCFVCHEPEWLGTSEPPHEGLFPTTCGDCHGNDAWLPAIAIRHDWFALRFVHAETPCSSCHTAGYEPGATPTECVGCHRADYDDAARPSHDGYPVACVDCHDESGWRPSTFDHPWTLDGAHAATPCSSCHGGDPAVYAGTPTECVGCHGADYDASPYPGHDGFPTTCIDCHTTAAWTPAVGGAHPEDRFPLRDKHDYECLDCHDPDLGPSTGGENTDCVGCHEGEHTRARMDDKHREEPDYPTGDAPPNFCIECHPDGRN